MHAKYRLKPQVIEALMLNKVNIDGAAIWTGGEVKSEAKASDPSDVSTVLKFPTMSAVITAKLGQWIIRNERGRFSVMESDVFNTNYEVVP